MDDTEIMEVNEAVRKYNSLGRKLTYADYASWEDDGKRYELIDGVVHLMGAPSARHQMILVQFIRQFGDFLDGKSCELLAAPFDVCLFGKGDDDETVVQPDVLIICDEIKLENGKYCNGAPDLVIEVLSRSTSRLDRIVKQNKYLQAGVREYWIVDPFENNVNVHILENGKYLIEIYNSSDNIDVRVLTGCKIDLSKIFRD